MPSRADIELVRAQNAGIVALATEDLTAFWGSLNLDRPERARDALLAFTPVLVDQYGEVAATVAADFYDDLRLEADVRPGFRARMAAPVPAEVVVAQTRFGAQHLWTDSPDQSLAFLTTALSKYVLEPGRATVVENAIRDPQAAGWHRETRPSASYTSGCRMCRFLAGRGGVYKRATATFSAHGGCHCVAVPSWDASAPEVGVDQYRASERMDALRRRAAAGDASAQRRLDRHNRMLRIAAEEYGG